MTTGAPAPCSKQSGNRFAQGSRNPLSPPGERGQGVRGRKGPERDRTSSSLASSGPPTEAELRRANEEGAGGGEAIRGQNESEPPLPSGGEGAGGEGQTAEARTNSDTDRPNAELSLLARAGLRWGSFC